MSLRYLVLFICAQSGAVLAECAPEKLVRMVTQEVSPGLEAGSFEREPLIRYRLGNGRSRGELQVNPDTGQQLLTVINTPDIWVIDLTSNTGEHQVDAAEPSTIISPVFGDAIVPAEISALEYGCEREFIAASATTHERYEDKSGAGIKHSMRSGNWKLTVFVKENAAVPMAAILSRDNKVYQAVSYLSYQVLESIPEGLFAPPAGIAFKEL